MVDLPGEAEDTFEVVGTDVEVAVPAGGFTVVVQTQDWNTLEPAVVERKFYVPGVGLIREVKVAGDTGHVELIEYVAGWRDRLGAATALAP